MAKAERLMRAGSFAPAVAECPYCGGIVEAE
jgi:hypothetical protein